MTWGLVGASDDGALSLSVFSTGKPSQDPPSRWCAIERANGASECTVNSLPDGRLVYQLWEPPHADAESFGLTDRDDPGAGKQWYVRGVMVLEPRTGFTVTVRQGTPATSVDDATGLLWLAPEELVAMATNPILDLDGALPLPAAGVDVGLRRERVDRRSQVEILDRQAAFGVCRQRERDGRPADVDVGMVVALLSGSGDGVDQGDALEEGRCLDRALDGVALTGPPVVEFSQSCIDLGCRSSSWVMSSA